MYKFRLLLIRLLTLVCLITFFVSGKLFAETMLPASDLPILSSQAFKDKVKDYNSHTQDGLCAALATLLGLKSPEKPPGCSDISNSNVPPPENTAADTSSQPAAQPAPATNSHTTSPQLNLYAN